MEVHVEDERAREKMGNRGYLNTEILMPIRIVQTKTKFMGVTRVLTVKYKI
jgi:hypothetical protein